jgi:hypothetical protein
MHPLDGINEKTLRAKTHFQALQVAAKAYVESNPCTLRLQPDPESGSHFMIAERLTPPPMLLSVIVGDLVHNLRSALDHMMWNLVEVTATHPPNVRTQFPIFDHPDKFAEQVTVPRERGKASYALGVDDLTLADIEGLQPYNRPENTAHAFSILGALSNIDKHQIPLPSAFALTHDPPPKFTGTGFTQIEVEWSNAPIREGAPVATVTIYALPNAKVEMESNFTVDVRFGPIHVSTRQLGDIHNGIVAGLRLLGSHYERIIGS